MPVAPEPRSWATSLYEAIVEDDDALGADTVDPEVVEAVPGNALRLVGAVTLQKVGDRIADPKTVLAWLVPVLGAPAGVTGLLVPVREAGSLLPQASLMPVVKARPRRKGVWMAGGVGQATAVAGLAVTAATLDGLVAGMALLACLACFALARAGASIAYKDVLGRTVPKGQRGRVSGLASMTSGLVAIAVGLGLRAIGPADTAAPLAIALGAAAALWVLAVVVFAGIDEPAGEVADHDDGDGLSLAWRLLREDPPFRRFVRTRALLLVSALSPPFVVTMAGAGDEATLGGLGAFVVAQGLAALIGGRAWGGMADRSSRLTMTWAAAAAATVTVAFLLAEPRLPGPWVHVGAYFLLALVHEGARLGRKTYVTDMAEGDQRTSYVASANTAMGVLLLGVGAVTAALAALGPAVALAALAVIGAAGALSGRSLPEVSAAG